MRRFGFALLLLSSVVSARQASSICGTTRDTNSERLFLHRQAMRARRARVAAQATTVPTADRDSGNIAIMEDSGGIVEKLNQFNLDGGGITFTPGGANPASYRY